MSFNNMLSIISINIWDTKSWYLLTQLRKFDFHPIFPYQRESDAHLYNIQIDTHIPLLMYWKTLNKWFILTWQYTDCTKITERDAVFLGRCQRHFKSHAFHKSILACTADLMTTKIALPCVLNTFFSSLSHTDV